MHSVMGLHRHVVRMVETPDTAYVVKELPDLLAEREYRLLRQLVEHGLPTAEVVGVVTGRVDDDGGPGEGLLITRHVDYSLPYRILLSGRGLQIPYLGERLLDSLAGLLVRLHLAGFYWGDCSLSNTLFRRDADALQAYIIDVETGELHESLSDGQRRLDLEIATQNVAGDLIDLQAGGLLADGIDPIETALAIEESYSRLWAELTVTEEFRVDETFRVDQRLRRLHDLGFDASELELVTVDEGTHLRLVPRVVEHGFHAQRLKALTGHRRRREPGRVGCCTTSAATAPRSNSDRASVSAKRSLRHAGWTSVSSRRSRPSRAIWPASSSRPSSTTRCSSTAGSSPRPRATTSGWPTPSTSYVRDVLTPARHEQITLPPRDDGAPGDHGRHGPSRRSRRRSAPSDLRTDRVRATSARSPRCDHRQVRSSPRTTSPCVDRSRPAADGGDGDAHLLAPFSGRILVLSHVQRCLPAIGELDRDDVFGEPARALLAQPDDGCILWRVGDETFEHVAGQVAPGADDRQEHETEPHDHPYW